MRNSEPRSAPRVLQVVQTLVAGGAETAVRALCGGLPGEGIEAGVVSVYPSGLDAEQRGALGVPLVDLGRRGRGDLGYFSRLVAAVREFRPDVVHAHLHTGQYPGRIAALLAAVPAIALTVHGEEPGGPVRWMLDRILHARTARFVVFSERQKSGFSAEQRVPLARVDVIPNGVAAPLPLGTREEVRAMLGLPQDGFIIYSAARLSPQKNQGLALEALARALAGGVRDAHLVFAGDGPSAADLHSKVRALGLDERVHFLGFRSDAAALGHAMDLFVMPSIWERMPFALGEAMMTGLAPVVTPWEGADEFVRDGDTGYIAPGTDAAALAAAIVRAYADPTSRNAVGERARAAAARHFDVRAMVRSHAALYRALCRQPA
jgi:glycosyltransferase involved in cell wall biosynthesis